MAMADSALKSAIISDLEAAGFKISDAPMTVALVEAIAKNVVLEVKKAVVTGTVTSGPGAGGAVTGSVA